MLVVSPTRRSSGRANLGKSLLSLTVTDDGHASDAAQVRRIAAGDDSALGELYDRYAPLVHGIARRLLGQGAAGDTAQEVFLTLWRHPERFDPGRGSLPKFLATITHRRCIDELRRTGRRAANEERAARVAPTSHSSEPETFGLQRHTASAVHRALETLPPDQRRAVELAYLDGLTFREVATVTGVSEGTAKSRLRLARTRLATALVHYDPRQPDFSS